MQLFTKLLDLLVRIILQNNRNATKGAACIYNQCSPTTIRVLQCRLIYIILLCKLSHVAHKLDHVEINYSYTRVAHNGLLGYAGPSKLGLLMSQLVLVDKHLVSCSWLPKRCNNVAAIVMYAQCKVR